MLFGEFLKRKRTPALLLLGVAAVLGAIALRDSSRLGGRVVPNGRQIEVPWRTLEPEEIEEGATVPADTQVIIHIPITAKRLTRKVLFGPSGNRVRYWGYCYPEESLKGASPGGKSHPGTVFLSEAERTERERLRLRLFPEFSLARPPTREELERKAKAPKGRVRHEQEIFYGGTTCYVMTAVPLPIGTDGDLDELNTALEKKHGTDPENFDTDGDGVMDGDEALRLMSDPTRRDTDNDGVIDGIEDANRNGRRDAGETDPLKKDSDGDGLCDGYCRILVGGRLCSEFTTTKNCIPGVNVQWRGEDKNLNGTVDGNETDPLMVDTDGDTILDEQEFFDCLNKGGKDC